MRWRWSWMAGPHRSQAAVDRQTSRGRATLSLRRKEHIATFALPAHFEMRIIPFIMVIALAWQAQGLAQDDTEPRAAPSRGLLKRGLLAKGKPTTTTTTQAPEEVEYEDDAEYVQEGENQEPSTEAAPSSTEGKKLVGSGVRPFRSNTDLLETLKRRRAQAAEAKLHGHTTSTASPVQDSQTEAPVKANFSKKRYNSGSQTNNEDSPSSKPSRSRFGRPSPKAIQEPEPEEQNDAAPPPSARTGRTFSRRGGN